jgi:hypothetical protein
MKFINLFDIHDWCKSEKEMVLIEKLREFNIIPNEKLCRSK